MECRECGTWNPDDKAKCWRCNAELPLPPKPRKSRKLSSQTWLWVIAILFSLLTVLAQCGFFGGDGDQGTGFRPALPVGSPVVRLEAQGREANLGQVVFGRSKRGPVSSVTLLGTACFARISGI
jgi:hypothetical protein